MLVENIHGVKERDVARGRGGGHVKRRLSDRGRAIEGAGERAHGTRDHHKLREGKVEIPKK